MSRNLLALNLLPPQGYIRQPQLIGAAPITADQARANKAAGKGPRRPRTGSPAIFPVSSATLWRMVKAGKFPAPVKLSEGITAWDVESVRSWLEAKAA